MQAAHTPSQSIGKAFALFFFLFCVCAGAGLWIVTDPPTITGFVFSVIDYELVVDGPLVSAFLTKAKSSSLFVLIIGGLSCWLAAIPDSNAVWRIGLRATGFLAVFLAAFFVARLNSFIASVFLVGIFTIYVTLKTPLVDRSRLVGLSVTLFFSSGIVVLAGWLPPFTYAQALKQSTTVHWLLDFRFLVTGSLLLLIVLSILLTAFISLWTSDHYRQVKKPLYTSATKKVIVKDAIPVPGLSAQIVVELAKWTNLYAQHALDAALRVVKSIKFRKAFTETIKRVAALWIIAHSAMWAATFLMDYLQVEQQTIMDEWPAQIKLLAFVLFFTGIAAHGVYTYASNTVTDLRDFFHSSSSGKWITFICAAFSAGLALWLLRFSGLYFNMRGFKFPGLFIFLTLAIAMIGAATYKHLLRLLKVPSD